MVDMSNPHLIGTLVEVFDDDEAAQAAVRELKAVGFTESQIDMLKSQHTIVTVRAGTRADIASSVLNRFNGSQRYPSQAM